MGYQRHAVRAADPAIGGQCPPYNSMGAPSFAPYEGWGINTIPESSFDPSAYSQSRGREPAFGGQCPLYKSMGAPSFAPYEGWGINTIPELSFDPSAYSQSRWREPAIGGQCPPYRVHTLRAAS